MVRRIRLLLLSLGILGLATGCYIDLGTSVPLRISLGQCMGVIALSRIVTPSIVTIPTGTLPIVIGTIPTRVPALSVSAL
jgi:hypothetical protein